MALHNRYRHRHHGVITFIIVILCLFISLRLIQLFLSEIQNDATFIIEKSFLVTHFFCVIVWAFQVMDFEEIQ